MLAHAAQCAPFHGGPACGPDARLRKEKPRRMRPSRFSAWHAMTRRGMNPVARGFVDRRAKPCPRVRGQCARQEGVAAAHPLEATIRATREHRKHIDLSIPGDSLSGSASIQQPHIRSGAHFVRFRTASTVRCRYRVSMPESVTTTRQTVAPRAHERDRQESLCIRGRATERHRTACGSAGSSRCRASI